MSTISVPITQAEITKIRPLNILYDLPKIADLVELCLAALEGRLDTVSADWDERTALGVVMAAGGYPEQYRKNDIISGLPDALPEHLKVFHAGTKRNNGGIVTNGGRVLCAVALGKSAADAQSEAYSLVHRISWPDAYYRTDIGYRAVARERTGN